MSDVRLTALNPDDSSPVPVACDAAGKLLLQDVPTFDGNLDGNLNVTGSGSFGSYIESTNGGGKAYLGFSSSAALEIIGSDTSTKARLDYTGSAEFAGDASFFRVNAIRTDASAGYAITAGDSVNAENAIIRGNGAATFAGGKAGFTSDGYLWCTTQSGDTVMLSSVSNGVATWTSYTNSRIESIKEKLESIDTDDDSSSETEVR